MPIQSRANLTRNRGLAAVLMLYLLAVLSLNVFSFDGTSSAQAAVGFASPDMEKVWNRTDKQVANGSQSRTWLWGPEPFTEGIMEAYEEAPGGQRLLAPRQQRQGGEPLARRAAHDLEARFQRIVGFDQFQPRIAAAKQMHEQAREIEKIIANGSRISIVPRKLAFNAELSRSSDEGKQKRESR